MAIITATTNGFDNTGTTGYACSLATHESGDLLVVFVVKQYADETITCPTSGWTVHSVCQYETTGNFSQRMAFMLKKATSSSETKPVATATQTRYWSHVALTIKGWKDTGTIGDAVNTSLISNNLNTSTSSLDVPGVTTTADNCLILYALMNMGTNNMYEMQPKSSCVFVNAVEGVSTSVCVTYKAQQAQGATGACTFTPNIAGFNQPGGLTIAIANATNGTQLPVGVDTTDFALLEPFRSLNAGFGGSFSTSIAVSTINSKTITYKASATLDRSGCFYLVSSNSLVTVLSADSRGFVKTQAANHTLSTGFLLGTYRFSQPADYYNAGTVDDPGMLFTLIDTNTNYDCWQIGAFAQEDMSADGRNTYVIQLDQTTNTKYGQSGTAMNRTLCNRFQLSVRGAKAVNTIAFNQLIYAPPEGLKVYGGSSANPISVTQFLKYAGGFHALKVIVDNVCMIPLYFGGTKDIHIDLSLCSLSFPKVRSSTTTKVHVDPGKFGITIKATANSTIKMSSGVFSAPDKWFFKIDSASSGSATYNFKGRTLVNANVSLRPVCTFDGMGFINCTGMVQNGATLTNCSFSDSNIISTNPGLISNSTFAGTNTTYASVEYRVDIGAGGTPSGNWVRVDGTTEVSMIDWDGNSTGAKVTVTGGSFTTTGVNQTSGDFPSDVISDGKQASATITTAFTGLPPGMLFNVIIMSSRQGANRHGKHTVTTSEYETFALKDGADNTTPFELTALVGLNGQLTITTIVDPAYPSDVNIPINAVILRGKRAASPAIKIITPGTYTLTNLNFTGYGADGAANAAIHNNSGGAVTLNIAGGSTPTILNGTGASTTVQSGATVVVNSLATGSRVIATLVSDGTVLHNGLESSGSVTFSVTQSGAIKVEARNASSAPYYKPWTTQLTPISGQTNTITALQETD